MLQCVQNEYKPGGQISVALFVVLDLQSTKHTLGSTHFVQKVCNG